MSRHRIGDAARKLHEKLADSLAGLWGEWLSPGGIGQVLDEIGYRFRRSAFSPGGDGVGLHRPSPRSGSFLQSGPGQDSSPSGVGRLAAAECQGDDTARAVVARLLHPGSAPRHARALLLNLVAPQVVPYRPRRVEPRVRKRRPKNYRLMTKPRSQLKDILIA